MLNATQLGDQIRDRVRASLAQRRPSLPAQPTGTDAASLHARLQERLQFVQDRFTATRPAQPSRLGLTTLPGQAPAPAARPTAPAPQPQASPLAPAPAAPAPAPAAPAASGDTAQLLGAMSAEDIERVLTERGSKLAGQGYGEYILAMEQKYGVPAAQFLAQAVKESQIGSDDGYAQPGFNIGNIRPGTSWNGPVVDGPYGQFRVYDSWEAGIEDYFRLLASPIYAGKSLKDQIYTYAPPSENDTNRYYTDVVALIGEWTGIRM